MLPLTLPIQIEVNMQYPAAAERALITLAPSTLDGLKTVYVNSAASLLSVVRMDEYKS
jgi:hypothetical protein